MPQLPWIAAPKLATRIVSATVNGEECSLEFPVYGAILSSEDVAIKDHEYQAVIYRESSALADALLADGHSELDAQRISLRILSTRMGIPVALSDAEHRAMLHHAAMVATMQSTIAEAYKAQVVRTVTAAIANRLPGCSDWSEADTHGLPMPLQLAIVEFIDTERNGNQPPKDPDELIESMADTLGKLAPVPSPSSPSTGPAPSGAAVSSGPTPPSSARKPSAASRSTTSAKRSRKASAG